MNRTEYDRLISPHLAEVYIDKRGNLQYEDNHYNEDYTSQAAIVMKTKTGGADGGGWQDDNIAKDYVDSDPERQEEVLDIVLGLVAPGITYLQYKKLAKELIEEESYRDNDYYGNHTLYKLEMINPDALYDYLKELVWKT